MIVQFGRWRARGPGGIRRPACEIRRRNESLRRAAHDRQRLDVRRLRHHLERQLNELQAAEDEPVPTFGLAREPVRETFRDALRDTPRAAPAPTPSWLDVVDEA